MKAIELHATRDSGMHVSTEIRATVDGITITNCAITADQAIDCCREFILKLEKGCKNELNRDNRSN